MHRARTNFAGAADYNAVNHSATVLEGSDRAWSWVEHLLGGGGTPWGQWPGTVPTGGARATFSSIPGAQQLALLQLRNISLARFYGERLAAALICSVMVTMLWWAVVQIGGPVGVAIPLGAVLAAAAFGWFLPALRIASSAQQVTEDASEALLVYIDLVVLGRMANKHARTALADAAKVCDNPVFINIRQALARAELEIMRLEHLVDQLNHLVHKWQATARRTTRRSRELHRRGGRR